MVTSIFPPETGGPATFISALAPALAAQGHQVRVFTLWDEEPDDKPDWLYGLSRKITLPLRLGLIFFKLLNHARWAELVYINGLELPAVLACRLTGRPNVLKIVGDYAWERARLKGRTRLDVDPFQTAALPPGLAFQRWLRGFYTRLAGRVVTPSRYLAELVAGWGVPRESINVVLNGLTPLPVNPPPAEATGDGQTILTAARLVNWKGVDHLIQALKLVQRPARLVVLGDGPDKERLEALARSGGLAERVQFRGRVGREAVLAAMAEADVFVLASGYEGLPHVVLEAMAMGKPVIAAAAGGTPEVVADGVTGLLVPYARPEALAAAIEKIFADPDLAAEMGRAGRQAVKKFLWEATVAGNAALITRIIDRH